MRFSEISGLDQPDSLPDVRFQLSFLNSESAPKAEFTQLSCRDTDPDPACGVYNRAYLSQIQK